jgi:hypothetical protein
MKQANSQFASIRIVAIIARWVIEIDRSSALSARVADCSIEDRAADPAPNPDLGGIRLDREEVQKKFEKSMKHSAEISADADGQYGPARKSLWSEP